MKKGELDKAIADYTEAIRLNPKMAEPHYNRGFAYNSETMFQTGEINTASFQGPGAMKLLRFLPNPQEERDPFSVTTLIDLPEGVARDGIQLASGRLIAPCCHTVGVNLKPDDPEFSHVIYSDDHGKTWSLGGEVGPGGDESTAVETSDGSLYLNCRNGKEVGHRAYARSRDGGLTFGPRQVDKTLPEPPTWGVFRERAERSANSAVNSRSRCLPHGLSGFGQTMLLSYQQGIGRPAASFTMSSR